jgi:uncharacterized C2H2 Zn-finger protein
MFLIAGISPKTNTIDPTPRMCPQCGLVQAFLKRTDSYFSLFFIPLFRVKEGEAFLHCERCNTIATQSGIRFQNRPEASGSRCSACGRNMERDYQFCPYCGRPV